MKTGFFLMLFSFPVMMCFSQHNNKASYIVEGGKTLVQLISVLKKKNVVNSASNINAGTDSCSYKQTVDMCFKNSTVKDMVVNVYRRNESGYDTTPFSMRVLPSKQECWYELRSGIYRYKIETDSSGIRNPVREGEIKLQACDNLQKEITD